MRVLAVLAVLALSACNAAIPNASGDQVKKWRDPETGCVYLVYGVGAGQNRIGSLSMRFREDGTPDCPRIGGNMAGNAQ